MKPITLNMHHKQGHPCPTIPYCLMRQAWILPGGGKATNKKLAVGIMTRYCMRAGFKSGKGKGV